MRYFKEKKKRIMEMLVEFYYFKEKKKQINVDILEIIERRK